MEILYDTYNQNNNTSEEKEISNFSFWDIYNNESISKSTKLSSEIRNKYLLNISKALKNNNYSIFFDKVSYDLFPDYYEFIPVLSNLNLIKERLENNFYSNEKSFLFDLELIILNSIIYNGEDDDITLLAKAMKNEILTLSNKRKENKTESNSKINFKDAVFDFEERRFDNLLSNKRRRDNTNTNNTSNIIIDKDTLGIISTRRRQQLK